MAIAGLPPLNGFASEWLTLQSLLRLPVYGGVADGTAGAIALAALAATAALAALCFVKVVGLVLLGPARREAVARAEEAPGAMRAAVVALAGGCVVLGVAPGLLFGSLVGLAPWSSDAPTTVGLDLPGTGDFRSGGVALVLAALVGALALLRGRRVAAAAPTWACGQLVERRLDWTSAGFTKPLRLVLEDVLRPEREIVVRTEGGVVREVAYEGRVPHHFEERLYRPVTAFAMVGAHHARRLQSGRLGVYVAYLLGSSSSLLTAAKLGIARVSATAAAATAAQLLGGIALAPLLPGLVQHWKARLQGRRGPSPLQPYRELRRLWGKSAVDVEGAGDRLPARALRSPPRASRSRCCSSRPRPTRPTSGSAATRSCSPGCSRSHASPWPRRLGTSRTASR